MNNKRVTFNIAKAGNSRGYLSSVAKAGNSRGYLSSVAKAGNSRGYLSSLAHKVEKNVRRICAERGLVDTARYLRKTIKCFFLQRLAASTLIEAMFELLKQTPTSVPAEGLAYFMPLLSCAQSMVLFDTYKGNRASFNVLFGSAELEGAIPHFMRVHRLHSRDLGVAFSQLRDEAERQIQLIQNDINIIAKRINSNSNGVNFAMKIRSKEGKVKYLWPKHSNFMVGSDYEELQLLCGGNFPFKKEVWLRFIRLHVQKRFQNASHKSDVQLRKENGKLYDDYSINAIKKSI